MFDLFNSKQGGDSQPVYAELINWQPINAQGKSVDIIAESLNYLDDSLDYMVVREQACGKNHCQIRIMANRDGTRFDERVNPNESQTWCNATQWRELTSYTPIGQAATPLRSEANGSLAPTLFEYLTGEKVVEGENGWGFPSLLHKLDIQCQKHGPTFKQIGSC